MRYVYPLYRWVNTLDTQGAPMYLYLFDQVTEFNFNRVETMHVPGTVPFLAASPPRTLLHTNTR